jgi:hypothetical protein
MDMDPKPLTPEAIAGAKDMWDVARRQAKAEQEEYAATARRQRALELAVQACQPLTSPPPADAAVITQIATVFEGFLAGRLSPQEDAGAVAERLQPMPPKAAGVASPDVAGANAALAVYANGQRPKVGDVIRLAAEEGPEGSARATWIVVGKSASHTHIARGEVPSAIPNGRLHEWEVAPSAGVANRPEVF